MSGRDRSDRRAVAIFGPTSSGKTAMSLRVARELRDRGLRPVVLNADSRQLYEGMDIGTSKISRREMQGVEHRLLDVATPDRKVTLERYAELAAAILRELEEDPAAVPIVVGGTGTFVKAVVDGWDVGGFESSRAELEREFPRDQRQEAFALLERLDARLARQVHANNYDATMNALARRLVADGEKQRAAEFDFAVFCMRRDLAEIRRGIETTLDDQFARGLLDEVRGLAQRYGLESEFRRHGRAAKNVVLQTHGYREFIEHAVRRGRPLRTLSTADLATIRSAILEHIHAYARRQRGWYPKLRHRALVASDRGVQLVVREVVATAPP